jgi:DNA-binding MarR family transcriptional regulator
LEPRHPHVVETAVDAYRRYWVALLAASKPGWELLDLTISQLKTIVVLECRGAITIGQVAEILGMSRSSASIVIEQLVQLGLVARTED